MNDRAAVQLILFGAALIGVGVLNLAKNGYENAKFRRQTAAIVEANPERVAEMRERMIAEENNDGRSSALD